MNIKNVNGKNVAYLEGEINAQTGAQVKAEINKLLDKGNVVILSFKSVVYMNSSGLREIIDLFKTASKNKKEVSLCDMNSDIREMFSFTGLDKVFKIYDTEAAAIG
ncbi:MAG: STAS domain-containing protein [Mucispirillum sp.]|nr:STAS domain-containing protein [Mucispirillum sp.]